MTLLIKKLLSYFPTKLPVGMTEFHAWADEIIKLTGKIADEDSLKFALANMVMHLKSDLAHVSKNYFVNSLRKGAANQVASQVFLDIKLKQKQAAETATKASQDAAAAQIPTPVEVTTPTSEVPSNADQAQKN